MKLVKADPLNFSESALYDFFENIVPKESLSVALDVVTINIFKGNYSDLKYLNKRNLTVRCKIKHLNST